MANFLEKKTYTKISKSKLTLALLLVIIAILVRGVWGVYEKERETRRNLAVAQAELAELMGREQVLSENVSFLRTQKGIETEIRKKFDVAREGERVIVLINAEEGEEETNQKEGSSIWNFIKGIFGLD